VGPRLARRWLRKDPSAFSLEGDVEIREKGVRGLASFGTGVGGVGARSQDQ
jgi:hypothetical protein